MLNWYFPVHRWVAGHLCQACQKTTGSQYLADLHETQGEVIFPLCFDPGAEGPMCVHQ